MDTFWFLRKMALAETETAPDSSIDFELSKYVYELCSQPLALLAENGYGRLSNEASGQKLYFSEGNIHATVGILWSDGSTFYCVVSVRARLGVGENPV